MPRFSCADLRWWRGWIQRATAASVAGSAAPFGPLLSSDRGCPDFPSLARVAASPRPWPALPSPLQVWTRIYPPYAPENSDQLELPSDGEQLTDRPQACFARGGPPRPSY